MSEETPRMAASESSCSPLQQERQKVSQPPSDCAPVLSKITTSTLDRSSNKIIIQTKEVPPAVAQAMSPPRCPLSKKSKRKEQRETERTLQHGRHLERSANSQEAKSRSWMRSADPRDGAAPAKKPKLDCVKDVTSMGVCAVRASRVSEPASPTSPENASLPESTHQSPRRAVTLDGSGAGSPGVLLAPSQAPLPPSATRAEEDTRPLDLSVAHRGLPAPVRRPPGKAPLVLPTTGPFSDSPPSPHFRATSPAVSLYQKPAAVASPATSSLPLQQQHHHHHHRSNSKGFLKGANLTCINPDPDSFHPRIVIKNLPPRATGASIHMT